MLRLSKTGVRVLVGVSVSDESVSIVPKPKAILSLFFDAVAREGRELGGVWTAIGIRVGEGKDETGRINQAWRKARRGQ